MTNDNSNRHHRRSIRLQKYDYSEIGAYFITICTYNRECLFGDIVNDAVILNELGVIAHDEWLRTVEMRKDIGLDEFVIMPNHLHGVITIKGHAQRAPTFEQFGKPTSSSVPTIIRGYKSAVTKQINEVYRAHEIKVWQRGYYEHVIRNEKSFCQIREYIVNNPMNWQQDEMNQLK